MIWAIKRFIGNNSYCVWKGKLHRFWQRMTRGWDDSELWSLDYTMAHWLLPRLREFKKQCHGMPIRLPVEVDPEDGIPSALTEEEWNKILDKMIIAFEFIADDGNRIMAGASEDACKREIERDKKIEEGIALFGLYFRALWD